MKRTFYSALAFVFAAIVGIPAATAGVEAATPYETISTEDLKAWLDRNTNAPVVVDTRNPEEYQEVHIKGAISIPEPQWDAHMHLLPADKSAPVVFYCNGVKCGKSKKAAKKAASMGYANIWVYAEGMPVWDERGMPIYAGPDYEKRIETTIISPVDLRVLIDSGSGDFTVVDVRDPEEYAEGHIPGAVNIPVSEFASQSESLDKNKKIIVYCNSGGRSYNAYRKLMKMAYENIAQAIFADWKDSGFPAGR